METTVFSPGFNGELCMSLTFFSKLLLANEKMLSWGIIKRTFEDNESINSPAICVKGIQYVFDILEGQFIKLENFCGEKMEVFPASVSLQEKAYLFRAAEGETYLLSQKEFLAKYKSRVLNTLLLEAK